MPVNHTKVLNQTDPLNWAPLVLYAWLKIMSEGAFRIMTLKESCPAKTALMAAWQSAAETYSKVVAELSRRIGTLPKAEYEKLRRAAENARHRSMEAQAELQSHIEEHGCDGNGEVAA